MEILLRRYGTGLIAYALALATHALFFVHAAYAHSESDVGWGVVLAAISHEDKMLEVRQMMVLTPYGEHAPAGDLYLILRTKTEWGASPDPAHIWMPFIWGKRRYSTHPRLYPVDLERDGVPEVAFEYHTGARHTVLEIFKWGEDGLIHVQNATFASGLGHVEVFPGGCVHETENIPNEDGLGWKIEGRLYQYDGTKFQLQESVIGRRLHCPSAGEK